MCYKKKVFHNIWLSWVTGSLIWWPTRSFLETFPKDARPPGTLARCGPRCPPLVRRYANRRENVWSSGPKFTLQSWKTAAPQSHRPPSSPTSPGSTVWPSHRQRTRPDWRRPNPERRWPADGRLSPPHWCCVLQPITAQGWRKSRAG